MKRTQAHTGRGCRRSHCALLLLAATAVLTAAHAPAQTGAELPPSPWPAELGHAFELYYAEEFAETQRVCRQIAARTRDPALRREAEALAALATMRLVDRDSRLAGRARLTQLAADDPDLLTRPECQLAIGIAQSALSETAGALFQLRQAVDGFAARNRIARLAEACVALAEAWARHGEWEIPVPGLELPRPQSPAQADQIRLAQIRALRRRVAGLPGCENYRNRIDLILARALLESGDKSGARLLEELADSGTLTREAAEAAVELAEQYEADQRWVDAARLYRRVEAARLGRLSQTAERRRKAIEQPQIVVQAPRRVGAGEQATVGLRVRNVATVEVEVRRVDLARWLAQRHGRFAESTLPISGALVAARRLQTGAPLQHGWWSSGELAEPLSFATTAGALVVWARATDGSAEARRLLLVGELEAAVFAGRRRALIWASGAGGIELEGARASFWMHGSFVPREAPLRAGIALLDLPPEARLLRDKRWVCLVTAGEEVTLCRGRLPAHAGAGRAPPAVALTAGPSEARPGQEVRVFGALLGGRGDGGPGPRSVEVELSDTMDRRWALSSAEVSPAGTFETRFEIAPDGAGENLRIYARLGGQVLTQVYRSAGVHVPAASDGEFEVSWEALDRLVPEADAVGGELVARYLWGPPVAGGAVRLSARAVRFPTSQPARDWMYSPPLARLAVLNAAGRWKFEQPLEGFGLPDGPLAVRLAATVRGWDGRQQSGFAELLVADEPVQMWLDCTPTAPRVGEPVHASVGWFDPLGRAVGSKPGLVVRRDGAVIRELELIPVTGGLRSRAWRPVAPGPYELCVTLPIDGADPVVVRQTIEVAGDRPAHAETKPVACTAQAATADGRPQVRARVEGGWPRPVLVLLADEDPLTAAALPGLTGSAQVLLTPDHVPSGPTRVLLVGRSGSGVQVLGATRVAPCPEDTLHLACSLEPAEPHGGGELTVDVTVTRGEQRRAVDQAAVLVRLARVAQHGALPWLPGETRPDVGLLPAGIELFHSQRGDDGNGVSLPEARELPGELIEALFAHRTLWLDSALTAEGQARFAVPLPPRPGFYRLFVLARSPDGSFARVCRDLDQRDELELLADLPPRLLVGDRSWAWLTIRNPRPTPVTVRATCSGNEALHVERPQPVGREVGVGAAGSGAADLTLAAGGSVRLRTAIEAVRAGRGVATFRVEAEGAARRISAVCAIGEAAVTVADKLTGNGLSLQREVFLLQREQGVGPDDGGAGGQPADSGWIRIPLEPGERLDPGALVVVQEQFTPLRALRDVEWEQRLPGNCLTYTGQAFGEQLRQVGRCREQRPGSVLFATPWLGAGRPCIHEYVMVAARPGACQFPAPRLRARGRVVRIDLVSEHSRVVVAASE